MERREEKGGEEMRGKRIERREKSMKERRGEKRGQERGEERGEKRRGEKN